MCEKGNQTIYHECAEKVREQLGRKAVPNWEFRLLIKRNGGCMAARKVDKTQKAVL